MLLELSQPWPVTTPHGPGLALLVLDYGPESHLMLTVVLDASGEIWTFESPQVRLKPNPTLQAPRGASPPPKTPTSFSDLPYPQSTELHGQPPTGQVDIPPLPPGALPLKI